ncbi:hypothetical protein ABN028_19630 [Actinopolymorpha sp. B17G11]|uniref:hypothetical protein n=1 Tax=Actinopolymorpha sp. B17G11 TaxID=3160861 RepID=UPI0032E45E2D
MAVAITKTEARKVARRARQYGHFRTSSTGLYVMCPRCRNKVETAVEASAKDSARMAALDKAMVEHLTEYAEECTP